MRKVSSFPLILNNTEKYKAPYSATVKNYGGRKKKLTVCKNRIRQSGLNGAFDNSTKTDTAGKSPPPPQTGPDPPGTQTVCNKPPTDEAKKQRFACNLSRARSTIYELALCNNWEWFLTFTLDPKKYDRSKLKIFHRDLARFIRKYRERHKINVKYLLVPEQHKDGINWHMHGFLMGLPEEHLRQFTLEEQLPYYIRYKLLKNEPVYDWEAYRKKFGFCNLEPIRDLEASAKYVTKYISKSMDNGIIESKGHLYYASQGLNRAEVTVSGYYDPQQQVDFDFENEHVLLKWYESDEQPETFVHADERIHLLREKRNKQFPINTSRKGTDFEPQWDPETGEIFKNPFDDPESFTIF
ncbi:rolling circle replication-associated protein [Lacrimispora sp.]|uniref:rolling circle replication-associated protein n=1 Tax=Lacrimispora sp. TaxID=2719234 RepID=UPI0028A6EDFC|nr:hypothetical protein [Lacrimispora sp.]